jgi:hypothetical protein
MPKKVKNTAVKPECFAVEVMFDADSEICGGCDVMLPCGTKLNFPFSMGLNRKEFEEEMASHNVAYADAVEAIVASYPNVTKNAAGLAYTRKVKKYRRKQYG